MLKFFDTKTAIDGSSIHLSMPISKVDVEKRMVHGFATLDNVDRQNDVVSMDASVKAFEQFRGNLREQHDSRKAVGRVLSFERKEYFDPTSNNTYKGVFVSAYVSKGAQDTWEKVLDGTLTGFSIGGRILDYENKVDKDENGQAIRIIKDFELMELSLVDSPANQLANILSVEKLGDNTVTTGFASNIELENVFWCATDKIAVTEKNDSASCPICSSDMNEIGWVESTDVKKNEEIGKLVDNFMAKADSVRVGDFVSWGSSGGTARGKVERVVRSGSIDVPGSDFTINAEEDNPAVLIRVYRKGANGWEPSDTRVGHKMSTLRRISSLSGKSDDMYDDDIDMDDDDLEKETVTSENTPNRNAQQGLPGGIPTATRRKKRKYRKDEGMMKAGDYVAFATDGKLSKGRIDVIDTEKAAVVIYKEVAESKFQPTNNIVTKNITDLVKIKVATKVALEKSLSNEDVDHLNTLVSQHNEKYGNVSSKNVSFVMLRKVFERGIAAFKSNPAMQKSDEHSPEQWAYARVNGFLQAVRSGKFNNRPYDTDLLPKGHPLSTEKSDNSEENELTLQKREGGVEMADNETSHEELDTAEATDVTSEEVTFEVEETVEDVVTEALAMAKSDGVEAEVADDTTSEVFDMEKALGEVKSFVEETINKSIETSTESLEKFSNAVVELAKAVDEKIGQLQSKYEEVTKGLAELNSATVEIANRVESVEEETAIKKSGELESSIPEQPIMKKSVWGGRFLSSADVFN
jgi:Zn finger protein HypA/HybF involved in hydrogenase expression